jgi:Holliday junction resolvase
MAVKSRRKGVKGEREVAQVWQAAGFEVRGLEGLGDHVVICGNGVTIHSEVKRAERLKLPEWLRQAAAEAPQGTVPVVAFRQNRGEWYAALPLEALAGLIPSRNGTSSDE